jgi:predicted transcriptional regulator
LNLGRRNPLKLKFEVKEDAANAGGLTIFGCNFGNYNQDIKVRVHYSPVKNENE